MSERSIKVEMDKNGCSYVVLSLVSIEVILRLGSKTWFSQEILDNLSNRKLHKNRLFKFP